MKKFVSITAAITSMTLLLSSAPISYAQSNESSTVQDEQSTLKLDKKATKLLTDAITKLAGKQTIEFTSVDTSFVDASYNEWHIDATLTGTAKADVSQRYDPKKGQVTSTLISYAGDDLNKVMDEALRTKITAFLNTFDNDKKFEVEGFWRVNHLERKRTQNYWVIWGLNKVCMLIWITTTKCQQVFNIKYRMHELP